MRNTQSRCFRAFGAILSPRRLAAATFFTSLPASSVAQDKVVRATTVQRRSDSSRPATSATRRRVALRRCSGRDPCRDRVRMAWSSPGDNAAVNVTSEAAHGAADCREPPTSTASRHMIELTSTRWDRLPNPSRICEVRCKSNFRRPPLSGNSSEGGRSVTSKVVAILLTFTDGTLHSLTEIASSTGIPTRQCTDWCPNLSRGASWSAPTMPSTESAWHCARSARRRMPYPSCEPADCTMEDSR